MANVPVPSIQRKPFGVTFDGNSVDQYILTQAGGGSARLITYGATLTHLFVPDKNGAMGDVVTGFDNLGQYENQSPYFGCTIGRFGNRIAQGIFWIDKVRYCVPINNGPNHLHGGLKGWDKRVWQADAVMSTDGPSVVFTLIDPDGTEGYPGNVSATVIYTLTAGNAIKIQYYATSDKATPINPTNHSYFNLKDGGQTDVLSHVMKIDGDAYTPVDQTLIPTGQIVPVKGTPIDFTRPKPIGQDIAAMGGYDHNLVLQNQDGNRLARAAQVYEPVSGRLMEVWTTEPGMQFYTGNFLDGTISGKNDAVYQRHAAFALECQHAPDSVNQASFPNTILRPGDMYRQITEYRFSASQKSPW